MPITNDPAPGKSGWRSTLLVGQNHSVKDGVSVITNLNSEEPKPRILIQYWPGGRKVDVLV